MNPLGVVLELCGMASLVAAAYIALGLAAALATGGLCLLIYGLALGVQR